MKGAYRMLQKAVRGSTRDVADCRSICDVNRSLLTAETPAHARVIMAELVKHPDVEIKWVKDRINHPTDGGWCDVLFLFSVRGSNGHVCEVQIAFKNMISSEPRERATLHTPRRGTQSRQSRLPGACLSSKLTPTPVVCAKRIAS